MQSLEIPANDKPVDPIVWHSLSAALGVTLPRQAKDWPQGLRLTWNLFVTSGDCPSTIRDPETGFIQVGALARAFLAHRLASIESSIKANADAAARAA